MKITKSNYDFIKKLRKQSVMISQSIHTPELNIQTIVDLQDFGKCNHSLLTACQTALQNGKKEKSLHPEL